jgi:putative membrane protein
MKLLIPQPAWGFRLSKEDVVGLLSRSLVIGSSMVAVGFLTAANPVPAQSLGEKTGINSALDIAPSTADFVKEVATSDMFELAASKLAQDKGNAPEKTFASQMIADHTKTSNELKGLVASGKIEVEWPTVLDSSHQSKLDRLKGEGGKDFTTDFDSEQVGAHQEAISLFERYAKGGDDADLKDWAGKTIPTLKHHLEMAQDLKKKPGGFT